MKWKFRNWKFSFSGLRRRVRSSAAERGTAIVEFALLLPLMCLIATGIWTFGFALNDYMQLTNGVALAAQQVALERGQGVDPCAMVSQVLGQASPQLKQASMTMTTTVYTAATTSTAYTGTTCSGASGSLTQGQAVTVNVTYPCTLIAYDFHLPCKLTAQVTEIVQ